MLLRNTLAAGLLAMLPLIAQAQDVRDPSYVQPIMEAIKPGWIAIRKDEGKDWVFFTPIHSWRCAIQSVHYGFNDAPPTEEFEMEACHTEFSNPNVSTEESRTFHVNAPEDSVQSVTVRLVYKDGTLAETTISRKEVLIP